MSVSGSGGCGKGMRGQTRLLPLLFDKYRSPAVISGNWITSADEPWREESDAEDAPGPPVEVRESGRGNNSPGGLLSKGQKIRCPAVPVHPKAAVAGCFAMPSSAYNGTPAQPQSQTMGAARRDPRRGEIPGAQRKLRSSPAAYAWGSSVEYGQAKDTSFVIFLDFRCHGDLPPTQTDDPRFSGIKRQTHRKICPSSSPGIRWLWRMDPQDSG